ncbi:RNA polymerase, sigma-24 subunit, ECF subfamily [Conexibacter woesei DSM 14684]|uniref:RNA polymerase, sigma-24 subunit, ECF subfamily n=2 Tax=Conexibacter TaxID=191494 RepID=D3EZ67_CONWI|nr:RNA polymerase, sigma-24 subunit, ECF subfamily [Conexibacter woesei DSM 14684]
MMELHDDALLAAAAGGDADAFAAFYRRHLAVVVGYMVRRTGNPEVAADLAAETFAAALLACPRYRPGVTAARAWLLAIGEHKLLDSRRRGRVESAARRRLAMERIELTDDDLDRVEELAAHDRAHPPAALLDAVEHLGEEQRVAVLARVVDERDYAEIAAELRCSEAVVRKRVSRGLARLRTQLRGAEA